MIRAGLRLVVENALGVEVVGEAADGVEAVAVARRERPDVLLLDIAMPRMDGLDAARMLLGDPDPPRIVMLTTFGSDANLHLALHTRRAWPAAEEFAARAPHRGDAGGGGG